MRKQPAIAPAIITVLGLSSGTMTATIAVAQPSCTGTNHCVDVTIANGMIRPVPDTHIPGTNHQIYWQIKTSGYSFPLPSSPTPGMAFKPPKPPKNEFHCNRVSATVFHCSDANTTHNTGDHRYQYSITVIDASHHLISTLDPWIVNK